jgi:hypothetical protein
VWLISIPLSLGIAGLLSLLVFGSNRVNKARFDQVQIGMSLEEIEVLLGRPDVTNWNGELVEPPRMIRDATSGYIGYTDDPESNNLIASPCIMIRFADGKVTEKKYYRPTLRTQWRQFLTGIKSAFNK